MKIKVDLHAVLLGIIVLGLILSLVGCSQQVQTNKIYNNTEQLPYSIIPSGSIKVYKIDSCEYIGYLSNMGDACFLTHKGNCKNKQHNK